MDRYDALVVLGGPMMPDQHKKHPHLAVECHAIEQFMQADKPVLGICLGSQLIAHTLGAAVFPASGWEIGWYPLSITAEGRNDQLLQHYPNMQPVYQWHGYTFDLPANATLLAGSEICPHQAFRYGGQTWGFQFHLELDQRLISRWLSLPPYLDELRVSGVGCTPEQILNDTGRHIEASTGTSNKVFDAFLDLLPAAGGMVLPSR